MFFRFEQHSSRGSCTRVMPRFVVPRSGGPTQVEKQRVSAAVIKREKMILAPAVILCTSGDKSV